MLAINKLHITRDLKNRFLVPIEKLFDLLLKNAADVSDLLSKTSELPFGLFISKTCRFDVIYCKNVSLTSS